MTEPQLRVSREYGDTMPVEQLAVSDETRQSTYTRQITEDERNSFNQEIVDLSVEESALIVEKKATMKHLNGEIKLKREFINTNLDRVRTGQMEVPDTISVFFDRDNLKVHEYNSKGERTLVRKMKPEEAQYLIK